MTTATIEPVQQRCAPFERPRGRRGVRGLVAVLAALAPVASLAVAHAHGTMSSSGGRPGYSYSWTSVFAHTPAAIVLWISAAVFVVGASVLWRIGGSFQETPDPSPVHGGATLPCLVYTVGPRGQRSTHRSSGPPPPDRIDAADDGYALLCFAHGRLAVRIGE